MHLDVKEDLPEMSQQARDPVIQVVGLESSEQDLIQEVHASLKSLALKRFSDIAEQFGAMAEDVLNLVSARHTSLKIILDQAQGTSEEERQQALVQLQANTYLQVNKKHDQLRASVAKQVSVLTGIFGGMLH